MTEETQPTATTKKQAPKKELAASLAKRLTRRSNVLLHRSLFRARFGEKIPPHWEVAAAVRIARDSSRPSGYCITARAAENAYMGEAVFIVAAARMYVDNPIQADGVTHPHVVWLNKGADDVLQVTAQKMDMWLSEFSDDATAGIPEMNYYFQKIPGLSPFYSREGTTRCHVLVDDDQFETGKVRDEGGMLSLRQAWQTWSYTDKEGTRAPSKAGTGPQGGSPTLYHQRKQRKLTTALQSSQRQSFSRVRIKHAALFVFSF
jgi:hypothetical protein